MTKTLFTELEKAVDLAERLQNKPNNVFYKIEEFFSIKKHSFSLGVTRLLVANRFKFSAYETNEICDDLIKVLGHKNIDNSTFEAALEKEANSKENPQNFRSCMKEIEKILKMTFWKKETKSWTVKYEPLMD